MMGNTQGPEFHAMPLTRFRNNMLYVLINNNNKDKIKLTEERASSADLTDPVTGAWTCQPVQLMIDGRQGISS